jgi:cyd operon protein YbgT
LRKEGCGSSSYDPQPSINERMTSMWYFAWILGVLLALAFGIINVMWYESEECLRRTGDPRPDN